MAEDYALTSYSQHGEDLYVAKLLSRIPGSQLSKWCVELGAWDGLHLSNVSYFINNLDYSAVLIEKDRSKAKLLEANFPDEKVVKVNRAVTWDEINSLDSILKHSNAPSDIDFLSIDIDGMDYYIFESLRKFRPKVVCIEFNPNIPNFISYIQEPNFNLRHGSSIRAITELGESKGYCLVIVMSCNAILVRDDLIPFLPQVNVDLNQLNKIGSEPVVIWSGFDGSLLSNKKVFSTPLLTFKIDKMQPLPKHLRTFFEEYGLIQRLHLLLIRIRRRIFT